MPPGRLPATGIADDKGYALVRDTYQAEAYDDVYAVGIAAAVTVAHPDDESFGLGALIAALVRLGVEVRLLCFTKGEASTLGTVEDLAVRRAEELLEASHCLGEVALLDYPDGHLSGVTNRPGSL